MQHLRRLVAHVHKGSGSLARRLGSGRPRMVITPGIAQWLHQQIVAAHGEISLGELTQQLRNHFHVGSRQSVRRMLNAMGYRPVARRVLPLLTAVHRKAREEWAANAMARVPPWDQADDDIWVYIDEKWFEGQRLRKRCLTGPGVPHPAIAVGSRAHVPKVMFLGAVARPKPDRGFSGAIGLYPVTEVKTVKRRQRHFNVGDKKHYLVNMNADLFKSMVKNHVCTDILRQTGEWVRRIVIQMDSAGGHGGGKADINTTTIRELEQWANSWPAELDQLLPESRRTQANRPTWIFVAQPARSPDLNMLDLGAWCSINSMVPEIRTALGHGAPIEQIITNVQRAWTTWNSIDKLEQLHDTLQHIYPLIHASHGGNFYKMPHFH